MNIIKFFCAVLLLFAFTGCALNGMRSDINRYYADEMSEKNIKNFDKEVK